MQLGKRTAYMQAAVVAANLRWSSVFKPAAMTLFVASAMVAMAAHAEAVSFTIPAQPLESALRAFAAQSNQQVLIEENVAQGLNAPAVNGAMTPREALDRLIGGAPITVINTKPGAFTLRAKPGADIRTLTEVSVKARRDRSGATEGTGSYTSKITSIASKTDQSFREIPQSVSVITRQQLDDRHIIDIGGALDAAPGVTLKRANADAFSFFSRGFQIDSMQVDGGAPLNIAEYTYAAQHGMAFYDRVEIMRGASGLLGGVGDPGGIINLVRKRPLATPQFIVEASAGSWNNYRTMIDMTGPLAFDGRLRGRAVAVYEDRDSHLDISHVRQPSVYGIIEADLTPGTLLTLGASHSNKSTKGSGDGLPRYNDGSDIGLPRHTNLTQPWATGTYKNTEVFGQLEHRFDNRWKAKLDIAHSDATYNGTTAFAYGTYDRASGTGVQWYGGGRYQYENKQDIIDLNVSGTFNLLGRTHEILLGLDYQKIQGIWEVGYAPPGTPPNIDIYNPGAWYPGPAGQVERSYNPWGQTQQGGYGVLRLHPTDKLHIIAGARYAKYSFEQIYNSLDKATGVWTPDPSAFNEPRKISPYGGIIYDLNDQWSTYFSYASILKPQALSKLGPPPGSPLAPIKGKSYEAGFKGELMDGKLNATVSVFHVERTGAAVADKRYPTSSMEWSGNCCFLPQGKVTSRGLDLEIGGEIATGWQATAGYTFNITKDKTTQRSFSSITPKHLLKVATSYQLPGELSKWKIGASTHIQSQHYVKDTLYDAQWNPVRDYDFTQGGYAIWNAMAEYQIDPTWRVTLNVKNLLDKTYYQSVGSASGSNYYGAPRNWSVTLRGQF